MKRLPAMQLWPPFTIRAVAATLAAAPTSTSSRIEVSVRSAELEHAFFEDRAGRSSDALPGRYAAGERHRGNILVLDQRFDFAARKQQGAEQIARYAGLVKHVLDRQRAAGHVTRVLQERAVARHQRRRGEAEDLPEGEVPRHHCEHDAERIEGDERLLTVEVDRLVGEIACGMVREPVAVERAFLDFGAAIGPASCPSRRS